MRKAFTLMELIVSLGILAIMMMFASTVFRVCINAQRMAVANSEIIQKLRVITDQLDADFRSMLISYGGQLSIRTDSVTKMNSDSIAFFANGDFQSTRQYGGKTIVGDVASILYGSPDPNSYSRMPNPQDRWLLRRQTILAPLDPNESTSSTTRKAIEAASDWRGEYYCTTLEDWRLSPPYGSPEEWDKRPTIDPTHLQTCLPMCLAKGVDNFTIWYLPSGTAWQTGKIPWYRSTDTTGSKSIAAPRAIKFEFTLYDSRGIIRNGRTFSHIVLLGG